jgi:hypothetical protein
MSPPLWLFGILALSLLEISGCSVARPVIIISQEQLQEKLDHAFPLERRYLYVFTVTLQHPKITLEEGSNRVAFQIEATTNVDIKEQPFEGRGRVSGEIRYKSQTGEFYLENAVIEELDLAGLPDKYRIPLQLTASLGMGELLHKHPFYTLNPDKFKNLLMRLTLQQVIVEAGKLKLFLAIL